MKDDIKISVVIPVYNSEKYIAKTLDSVCKQSLLPYEVVIIDDGSKDRTVDIINRYVEKHHLPDNFINVYSQKNAGAGEARNTGILKAKGNWVSFLDSDDIWNLKKIEYVYEAIKAHSDCVIITHDQLYTYEDKRKKNRVYLLHKNYNPQKDFFVQLYKGNLFSTSCMTIKKEVFISAGVFDTTLQPAEDYDMWMRISMYGNPYFIKKVLATYRVRSDSISSERLRRYNAVMRICRNYFSHLEERVGNKAAKKIARRRIFMIHRVEAFLALKSHDIGMMFKIIFWLIPQYVKKIG